jgi:urocanate hydratase
VTVIADGTREAEERLDLSMTNDTTLGVMRYADAGYPESFEEIESKGLRHFRLP